MFCCCAASENEQTTAVVFAEAHPGTLTDERLQDSAIEKADEQSEPAHAPQQAAPTKPAQEPEQQPLAKPVPDNPAVAPSIPEPAVVIVFETENGSKVEHTFTKRPLGMEWQKQAPLTLARAVPGTAAGEKGLQPGWTVMTINGENIAQSDYEGASATLKSAVLRLPATSVTFTFKKPDGSSADLAFARRPIGMEWKNKMPLTVSNVVPNTPSAEQGLRPGWALVALNGESVAEGEYADVSAKVKAAALTLPKQ